MMKSQCQNETSNQKKIFQVISELFVGKGKDTSSGMRVERAWVSVFDGGVISNEITGNEVYL